MLRQVREPPKRKGVTARTINGTCYLIREEEGR